MPKARLSREAENELEEIWSYIVEQNESHSQADRVIDQLTDDIAILAANPHLGRQRNELRKGMRSFSSGNYLILYRVTGGVLVLHIIHGRRDLQLLLPE